jgi:hypothetical protein
MDAFLDLVPYVSEHMKLQSSGFLIMIWFHTSYRKIIVDQPIHKGILFMIEEHSEDIGDMVSQTSVQTRPTKTQKACIINTAVKPSHLDSVLLA